MTNEVREQEVWKQYPEYDFIEVSDLGRVRTKDRYVPVKGQRKRFVKGRVLKQQCDKDGYMRVHFRANGKNIHRLVHRMVTICFVPNPHGYPEVNHLDGNPANNTVSNLEWCTNQYNIAYREKHGVPAKEFTKVLRKPLMAIDLDSFKVLWFESQHEAMRQLGVLPSHITRIIKGEMQKTHGYWFCYADENAVEKTRIKFGDEVAKKVEELLSERKII